MVDVLLATGGDIGDRIDNHRALIRNLNGLGIELHAESSVYWNKAVGFASDVLFANRVLLVRTALKPLDLLVILKSIEDGYGRVQSSAHSSRPMDIDILLYGNEIVEEDELTIPHPRMLNRAFVLVPACELAADRRHPTSGRTLTEHLAELSL